MQLQEMQRLRFHLLPSYHPEAQTVFPGETMMTAFDDHALEEAKADLGTFHTLSFQLLVTLIIQLTLI